MFSFSITKLKTKKQDLTHIFKIEWGFFDIKNLVTMSF